MKTKIYLFFTIIAAGFLGLSACTEDFLKTDIPQVDEGSYFNNVDNAKLALTGCYNVMAWDAENQFPFWLGDILGHDSWKGGEGAGDQPWVEPLLRFQYSANNEGLVTPYKNYFIGVGRCNRFIERVGEMTDDQIDPDLKDRFIAEAKFVRGYFYFELVKTFGSVPLITKPMKPVEYKQTLADVASIYAQIEADFTDAVNTLPKKNDYPASEMGRATKGAARAMLCKAYIYQKKWAQALVQADSIIVHDNYSLEPNFADNWDLHHENGVESVFEIQFGTIAGGSAWGDENAGNVFVIFTRSRNDRDGWGFNCPSQNLYDEFEVADNTRRDATFITNGETIWAGTDDEVTVDCDFPSNIDKMCSQKYQLPTSQLADNMSDDPNNWIVVRYAEVLLWASEAAYYAGPGELGDWEVYLNKVRNDRDDVKLGNSPYRTEPLRAIFHERRCELAMEGHAFWDIIRSDRGATVFGIYGYTEANRYLPIPQSEQDLIGL
ncbi:MAG TPA: RagB/SusD family nutrient uptake outer membrane protein [Bacteroidales bacterium]|nr:RagB/SusD family nutrient uptake outer membrane protein [Bacteroidales bacterium]